MFPRGKRDEEWTGKKPKAPLVGAYHLISGGCVQHCGGFRRLQPQHPVFSDQLYYCLPVKLRVYYSDVLNCLSVFYQNVVRQVPIWCELELDGYRILSLPKTKWRDSIRPLLIRIL